jgi:hypothetical protein
MDNDKGVSDILKKVISVGVGAAFMTEDVVKKTLQDLPISKEILGSLLSGAANAKADFMKSINTEVRDWFEKVDPKTILEEVLENYDITVTAHLKFNKKNEEEEVVVNKAKSKSAGKKKSSKGKTKTQES